VGPGLRRDDEIGDIANFRIGTLGSRLNHSHQMTMAARNTAAAKLVASLSYRVAMRRQSFNRQNIRSIRLRSL
jgi:hypothetical protein